MKRMSKKLMAILLSAFVLVFFCGITLVMAATGKIDLSEVPLVSSVVNFFSASNYDTEALYNAVATDVRPTEDYTSITDVATADGFIYSADKTGMKVYKSNTKGDVVATYQADQEVNAVFVNGNTVYALIGNTDGKVVTLDTSLKADKTLLVGHTPSAMAVSGNKGYIANRYDNSVSVIDLNSNTVTNTVSVNGREAIDLAVANGKLYVACHLPENASTEQTVSANVVVIDTATDTTVKTIELVNGAGGVKGITASPDGNSVYVSHIIARYTYPTTQLDRGWINTNGFSVINTSDDSAVALMLDEVELGAANPWGVKVSDDGKKLAVAISGTDEIMIVDIDAMNAKINAVKAGNGVVSSVDKIVDYIPFLDDCRTRISLNGKGARALTIADGKVYVGQYFTADLAVVDLSTNKQINTIVLAEQPENDVVRHGEILFSDANLCYQKWQSCLSCHPDALADGLNWDNLNDGLGNPKSAKSMLYSHRTPPVMVTGIRANAEIAVRAGMKYIQFNVLEESQLDCIDKYLMSLQPMQSPYLNKDGTLTESAERGKSLFESQGCVSCHPAPLYTDLKLHDVGTADNDNGNWEDRSFDTPTLVEVWRTGAWMHDGRFNNMSDVIRYFAPDLSDSDITDLANFVLSIGDEGEQYGVEQVFVYKDGENTVSSLVPGGKIVGITVRRQQKSAAGTATVKAVLTNSSGNVIKSFETTVSNLAFNNATAIEFGNGFDIPAENTNGVKLTVTIKDSSGENIASPYVITY